MRPRPLLPRPMALPLRILIVALLCAVQGLAASGPTLRGRILDNRGNVPEGTVVELIPVLTTAAIDELLLAGQSSPPAKVRAIPDASGAFVLQAPDIGMWRVRASAPGYVQMQARLIPLIEDLALPPVHLESAISAAVRLLTSAGEPVGGASLAIYRPRGGPDDALEWIGEPVLASTNSESSDEIGVARFAVLEGEDLRIHAVASDHAPLKTSHQAYDGLVADMTLDSGTSVTLEVSDPEGRPKPNVLVFDFGQPLPLGRTDENGQLPLTLTDHAMLRLVAEDGSFQLCSDCLRKALLAPESRSAPAAARKIAPLDITLRPPILVHGVVRDAASGEGIAKALVWPARWPGNFVRTDPDGNFELISSDPQVDIQAIAPGYLADRASLPRRTNDVHRLDLHLTSRSGLSGRIIDGAGRPAPGVDILPQPLGHRRISAGQSSWATSDAKGQFRLDGLANGQAYQVLLFGDRWADTVIKLEPLEIGERRQGEEWRVSRGLVGLGLVVDEDDQPVAGASVFMRSRRALLPRELTTTTDEEGHFAFNVLAPLPYDLRVEASGFATATIPGIKVLMEASSDSQALASGEEIEIGLGVITLSPGVALTGRVKNTTGQAIAGATIDIVDPRHNFPMGGANSRAQSDDEGHFSIVDRRRGEMLGLFVTAEGYRSHQLPPFEVDRKPNPVSVVLEQASRIVGQVIDEQGNALRDVRLVAIQPDQRRFERRPFDQTDALGRFEIDGLSPGASTVKATKQGFRAHQVDVQIPAPDQPSEALQIVLETGLLFQGTILGMAAEPLERVDVSAFHNDERYNARSNAEGRFDFAELSPGIWTLHFRHPDHSPMTQNLDFGASAAQVFRFPAGVAVSGRVLDHDDTPMSNCMVYVQNQPPIGMPNTIYSDDQGAFIAPHVAPGKYRLGCTCKSDGLSCELLELEVTNAPLDDVIVRVPRGGEDKGTLYGTVAGLSDDDYSQVIVSISRLLDDGTWLWLRAHTINFEGAFVAQDLPSGVYHVAAELPRGRQATARVEIDGREIFVELKPASISSQIP